MLHFLSVFTSVSVNNCAYQLIKIKDNYNARVFSKLLHCKKKCNQ